ncbi:hypothetical protein G6F56_009434 [Rhizopus delemar]|nr:hypothetical protein G6F56_009434 [Rhizopus delemar]
MYNNTSFNNHDLNAYNNEPPFDNRLSSKRGSTYGRGRLSNIHVDPTGLNNTNNSQAMDQNNQMDYSDVGDQSYHHSSTANHGLGQDSSFDNLSATSRPKDAYGRQQDQSFGKGNQSFGNDNQSFGNDNQAFGNDNQALGNDNQAFGSNNQSFGSNNQSFGDNNQALGNNNNNHHKMATGAGVAGAGALGAAAAGRHGLGDHNSSFGSNDRSLGNQDYENTDRSMAAGPGATSQGYDSTFDNNNSSYGNQDYGSTDRGMATSATGQGQDSFNHNTSNVRNTEIPSPEKADSYGDKTAHNMVSGAGALGVAGAGVAGAHHGLSNQKSTHSNLSGNDNSSYYPENLGERTASGYSSHLDTDRHSQQMDKSERALDEQPHRHDHSSGALGTGRQSSTRISRHDHSSGALGTAGAVGAGAASNHHGNNNNNSIDSQPTHTSAVDPSQQNTRDSSDLRQKEPAATGAHATGQTGAATGATSGGVVPGLGAGALGTGAVESVVKNDQGINENTGREMEEEEQKAAADHKPSATEKIKGNLEKVAGKLTGNQTKVAKGDDIAHGRSL